MTSYRTLVFGTIAVICAAAPAYADSLSALPGPHTMDSLSALPGPKPADSLSALPGPKPADSLSALPKSELLTISGIPGLPPMVIDLGLFRTLIRH